MTCQRAIDEFLMRYLEGELRPLERARFQLHLAICSACRRYLESYRQTVALGKAVAADPEAPISPDVPEALIAAVRKSFSDHKSKL